VKKSTGQVFSDYGYSLIYPRDKKADGYSLSSGASFGQTKSVQQSTLQRKDFKPGIAKTKQTLIARFVATT
jgi:hypothetical protein